MTMIATGGRTFTSPTLKASTRRWRARKREPPFTTTIAIGTFTDVTDKAGVGYPCWAMGAVVGDYNN